MNPSQYRIVCGAGIAAAAAAAADIAASLLIRNIAAAASWLGAPEALYPRLIQLRYAHLVTSWLFPLIFGLIIACAAMSEKRSSGAKAAAAAVIALSAAGAFISAILEMKVNDVPLSAFLTILIRYIGGGLLDAL